MKDNKVLELVKTPLFPQTGTYFYVKYTRNITDGSFRGEVFKCLGEDNNMVVAETINGIKFIKPLTFVREHWEFSPVSESVLNALGICIPNDPVDAVMVE